jgi:hypothetical protein
MVTIRGTDTHGVVMNAGREPPPRTHTCHTNRRGAARPLPSGRVCPSGRVHAQTCAEQNGFAFMDAPDAPDRYSAHEVEPNAERLGSAPQSFCRGAAGPGTALEPQRDCAAAAYSV